MYICTSARYIVIPIARDLKEKYQAGITSQRWGDGTYCDHRRGQTAAFKTGSKIEFQNTKIKLETREFLCTPPRETCVYLMKGQSNRSFNRYIDE